MKRFCIFTVAFFLVGISSAVAQDLIIMRDGNVIEARVTEISPMEIRYKRYAHLDGPTIVIAASKVLSIRYENGTSEIITAAPVPAIVPVQESVQANPALRQRNAQARSPQNTAMSPDRFLFGVNVSGLGAIFYVFEGEAGIGPSVSFEFSKGNFNSEINFMFPWLGFGFLSTFNYFWHHRIGGAYLGGGIGYSFYEGYYWGDRGNSWYHRYYTAHSFTFGLNTGYKFVTRSGVYFRTGAYVGFDFGYLWNRGFTFPVYIKPDLVIGWTMR